VEFQTFDEHYIRQLRDGDPRVQEHFAKYFGELIYLKLRRRVRSMQLLEDIRQETLCRVLRTVRARDGIEDARKFGAFVTGVCNFVMAEFSRSENRYEAPDRDFDEHPDATQDFDAPLISDERRKQVRKILGKLEDRDRKLLKAIFFDELPADEICRRFQVGPDYLRVLVFRAKARFKQVYVRGAGSGS